jgi:hypothetical protein
LNSSNKKNKGQNTDLAAKLKEKMSEMEVLKEMLRSSKV